MGMTKASVLPLPVTCEGRRRWLLFPHGSFWRGDRRTGRADAGHSPLPQRRLCFSGTEGWLRTEQRGQSAG